MISEEIEALVKRGNITLAEYKELRVNSWEHEHVISALDDEAYCWCVEHAFLNAARPGKRPYSTYEEALVHLHVPELLRRWFFSRGAHLPQPAAPRGAKCTCNVLGSGHEARCPLFPGVKR